MYAHILRMSIVNKDIILCYAVLAYSHDPESHSVKNESLVAVLSEYHLFAMAQNNGPVCTELSVRDKLMCTVIEDDAVGKHLHHRASVMLCGSYHDLRRELELRVKTAREESSLCSENKASRIERMLDSAVRRGLGYGSET